MRPSFFIVTFGCKVNQYDSQLMREALVAAGFEERPQFAARPSRPLDHGQDARATNSGAAGPEFAVIDTCTVTAAADAKARHLIRRIARELPGCRIVVAGCMVDRDRGQFARLPGVWALVGNADKPDIAGVIIEKAKAENTDLGLELGAREHGERGTGVSPVCGSRSTGVSPVVKESEFEHGQARPERSRGDARATPSVAGIFDFAGHTRAFVKAQDGCAAGCAYCIVPSVRGRPRSRPIAELVGEVRRLAERFPEIVLSGIHIGRYEDGGRPALARLIRAVLDATPVARLRLSSIEVNEISPELLDLAAESPRFCPHFHVPLQSGSDHVLERMNRRYTAREFLDALARIRERLDRPAFTTDVMVGFPGERDEDFARTVAVCEAAGFSRIHVFRYSDRPGTAAAAMRDKCPAAVVRARETALEALASDLALAYKKHFVGETVAVLVESERDRSGKLCGYTDRYLRVVFDGPDEVRRRIMPVRITSAEPVRLWGERAGAWV